MDGAAPLNTGTHVAVLVLSATCVLIHALMWTLDTTVTRSDGRRIANWRDWLLHIVIPVVALERLVLQDEDVVYLWPVAAIASVVAKVHSLLDCDVLLAPDQMAPGV